MYLYVYTLQNVCLYQSTYYPKEKFFRLVLYGIKAQEG